MKTLRALKFLFVGPMILAMLFVINWMTSPGDWWVQWAALGLGIAWVISRFRLIRDMVVLGGLSALGIFLWRRREQHRPRDPGRI